MLEGNENHKISLNEYEGKSTLYFSGDPEIAQMAYDFIKEKLNHKTK